MTHAELMTELFWGLNEEDYTYKDKALRAVVELHKPKNYIIKGFEATESWCTGDSESLSPYPCATIQAIEKEL
jgi:hypothetical protein